MGVLTREIILYNKEYNIDTHKAMDDENIYTILQTGEYIIHDNSGHTVKWVEAGQKLYNIKFVANSNYPGFEHYKRQLQSEKK